MKTGSINVANDQVIPAEGSIKSQDGLITFELYSDDLGAADNIALQGSLSGVNWDTLQEAGADIALPLDAGDTTVRSFTVDKNLYVRLLCTTGTGTISYYIAEGN